MKLIKKLHELGIQLTVSNDDLKIKAPKGVLTPDLISQIKEEKENLLTLISNLTYSNVIPISTSKEYYPLSSSQNRLWVLSQFEGGNMAYNIPGIFQMKGVLDVDVLEKSFRYLIGRHESLRTRFVTRNDEVYQQIINEQDIVFTIDKQEILDGEVEDLITHFYKEEFDLSQAPLLKARILQTSSTDYYLLFSIHHIIGDGWSMEVLSKELMYVYNHLLSDTSFELPELRIHYKDYVLWLESEEIQNRLLIQEAYWKDTLSGELPVLELPSYKKRPLVKTYNGATKLYDFSQELSAKLTSFSKAQGITLYMSLLSGINGLFYRYTNATDIILGAPIAGRSHPELEHQVGLYLNTLAIRTVFDAEDSFRSLLEKQKQTLLEAYEHQDYPLDRLVEDLSLKRDISRSALFDVMVVLQNQQEASIALDNLAISAYKEISRKVSQFDMTFSFSEDSNGIHLRLEYNSDIYDAGQVDTMCIHLERFIDSALDLPEQRMSSLPYLTDNEEKELLDTFNTTEVEYPKDKTVVDLFRDQVANSPASIAIVYEKEELTYQESEVLSNAMANDLLSTGLIDRESLIGVELERSEWLIISLLAVLKTGGAYVPIDPSYPKQRIDYIKEDSQCAFVITESYIEEFKQREKDTSALEVALDSHQLAYIIYTSGSTGKPKGVMIEHKNTVALIQWSSKEFDSSKFDMIYFSTSHCFDLSVYEIFYPLSIGKTVRILENGLSIPTYLEKDKNVLINTVPSVVQSFIEDHVDLLNVSILNMAGEVIPSSFTKSLSLTDMDVYNLYGPSEDTTYSTYYKIETATEESISIGNPIANTQVYILNGITNQLQPKGVIGELCVSGVGLSRGYLNHPELTAEKFIAHPFKEGARLYKTGDLARWLPDGTIEFIGRKDSQVKIRGYRIELGEIEYALTSQEDISQAVVTITEHHEEKHIVAYVIYQGGLDAEAIKSSLREYLPGYMIPNHIIQIDTIPLTPNGKIDKESLPKIKIDEIVANKYVSPRNEIEKQLVVIWQEVLKVEKIGITDNFFELGGHSLKAIRLVSRIQEDFLIKVSMNKVFEYVTIKKQSQFIENSQLVSKISKDEGLESEFENFTI